MASYLGRIYAQESLGNSDSSMSQRWYSHSDDIDSSCSCSSECSSVSVDITGRPRRKISYYVQTLKPSIVPILREIYILYNAYDDNYVSNILLPRLDNDLPMIFHLRWILSGQERHLNSWPAMELKDRDDCKKVAVVVLSDHYLQDIQRTSQYKEIHRCHKTLIIQVGKTTTSDVPYKLFGQICIKISWFTWPEQKDEPVGFWNVFTSHIDP